MSHRRNIKVSEEVFEQVNEERQELGLTWSEYLLTETPDVREPLTEEQVRSIVRSEVQDLLQSL